jgi:hypothetical protein
MSRNLTPKELDALCAKYREILRLRNLETLGCGDDPRPAMRQLAARFPGSLRELDCRPLADLEERLAILEGARRGERGAPDWAALQSSFHTWLRAALRLKRAAARSLDPDPVASHAPPFRDDLDTDEELPVLDDNARDAILRPIGGRVLPWVLARVADLHATTPELVAAAVFAVGPGCLES